MKLTLLKTRWLLFSIFLFFNSADSLAKDFEISADRLKYHTRILGADSLAGRAPGTDGIAKAADYISSRLRRFGLVPAGAAGTFSQPIPMHGSRTLEGSELILYGTDSVRALALGDDYLLYKSGAQTYIPNPVPLVFVGYGIIAPEFDYNDYQDMNVEGKIVVFLDGEPVSTDPGWFGGTEPTIYSYPESKQRLAISRGAIGSILINAPGSEQRTIWQRLKYEFHFEDVTLAYRVTGHLSLLLNDRLSKVLFDQAPYAFSDIRSLIESNRMQAFGLNRELSFRGKFRERDFISSNIAGVIPGTDPDLRDSYILLSAHYDHLGIGKAVKGDSVYNGVLDNAIGVAGLLELARTFSEPQNAPRRSILFLFLTGEEKGLLGSSYYVDHPLIPLYRTFVNINVDGLGFIDTFRDIVPVGAELSDLGDVIGKMAADMGIGISRLPEGFSGEEAFSRSDQVSFARGGIPSVLIADGYDYINIPQEEGLERLKDWFRSVYHTPFDEMSQPLNFKAAVYHLRIITEMTGQLADFEGEIEWKSGSPYKIIRLRTIAEQR